MIEDSRVPVVLAQRHLRQRLQAYGGAILFLDEAAAGSGPAMASDADDGPEAGQLAYVIYTSGSTGRPKGCRSTTAASSIRSTLFARSRSTILERTCCSPCLTLSFDVSVLGRSAPLMVGGNRHRGPEGCSSVATRLPHGIVRPVGATFQSVPSPSGGSDPRRLDGAPGLTILSGERRS